MSTTAEFAPFGQAVRARFDEMKKHELYIVDVDPEELWQHYLASFPEGTDPVFRERTEHDCSCCRNFVKNVGAVVSLDENYVLQTVWDVYLNPDVPEMYKQVAHSMDLFVFQHPIKTVYRTTESQYGTEMTPEIRDGKSYRWEHFSAKTGTKHKMSGGVAEVQGKLNTAYQVMQRGLEEITVEAVDQVRELIDSEFLYRGEEHLSTVSAFQALQRLYKGARNQKENFLWANVDESPAALFRNTVIGTLALDLSNGVDLEEAVCKFESKVAPQNYKRSKSLITQSKS